MHDIIEAMQEAITSSITGNPEVMENMQAVYDNPPENTSLPYMHISNINANHIEAVEITTFIATADIDVHMKYNGKQQALTIIGKIINILQQLISQNSSYKIAITKPASLQSNINKEHEIISFRIRAEYYVERSE